MEPLGESLIYVVDYWILMR